MASDDDGESSGSDCDAPTVSAVADEYESDDDTDEYMYEHESNVDVFLRKVRSKDRTVTKMLLGEILAAEDYYYYDDDGNEEFNLEKLNEDVIKIAAALKEMEMSSRLTELDIYFEEDRLVMNEAAASVLGSALASNKTLEKVEINLPAFLGGGGGNCIAKVLNGLRLNGRQGGSRLKHVIVHGEMYHDDLEDALNSTLSRANFRILCDFISANKTVEILDLQHNVVPFGYSYRLRDCLRKNKTISTLHIDKNEGLILEDFCNIGNAIEGHGKVHWITTNLSRQTNKLIARMNNLDTISIRFWAPCSIDVSNEKVLEFAKAFRSSSIPNVVLTGRVRIDETSFVQCETISNSVLPSLSSSLVSSVHCLKLSHLPIGDLGAETISKAFSESHILESLTLDDCEIGGAGAEEIASLIKNSDKIQSISLSENKIGTYGAKALTVAFHATRTLMKSIVIDENKIGETGTEAIVEALWTNSCSQLECLNLSFNEISIKTYYRIAEYLESGGSLRELEIIKVWKDEEREAAMRVMTGLIRSLTNNRQLDRFIFHIGNLATLSELSDQRDELYRVLKQNHTLRFMPVFYKSCFVEAKLKANTHHPILASTIKGSQFPSYLIENLPDSILPAAIACTEEIAGLDGVYSLTRLWNEGMLANVDTKPAAKRGAEEE